LVRNHDQEPLLTNEGIAALASQFFLSAKYRTWLAKRIALRSAEPIAGHTLHTLTIDVNHLASPSAILSKLIHLNTNLVFAATEPHTLQSALDLIYARLEKDASWQELARYWKGHVSWYVGSVNEDRDTYLRFLVDDR